jgi:hypothetical protein
MCSTSGVLRFAGFKNVIPYHDFLSEWAAQTGVPALFLAFQGATMSPAPGVWPPTDFAAKGLGVLLAYALGSRIALPKDKRNRFNTLVAAAPLFYVIRAGTKRHFLACSFLLMPCFLSAITNKSPITALGAAMFLGSAAVGTTGRVGGFLRVDVFHYVLSGAVITLSLALNQQMF